MDGSTESACRGQLSNKSLKHRGSGSSPQKLYGCEVCKTIVAIASFVKMM